jgi:hypothetical protein
MINKAEIKDVYNEALEKSQQSYELQLQQWLENYIRKNNKFTIEELIDRFHDKRYSVSYTRSIIMSILNIFYVGIREVSDTDVIVKFQNKTVQEICNNFDFKYKPELVSEYSDCINFANDDIFSQEIIEIYHKLLQKKDKIEQKIKDQLLNAAERLDRVCVINLTDIMIPKNTKVTDFMFLVVYNYIVRSILIESQLLFEMISDEEDNFIRYKSGNSKTIRYDDYRYKVRGYC